MLRDHFTMCLDLRSPKSCIGFLCGNVATSVVGTWLKMTAMQLMVKGCFYHVGNFGRAKFPPLVVVALEMLLLH